MTGEAKYLSIRVGALSESLANSKLNYHALMVLMVGGGNGGHNASESLGARSVPAAPSSPKQRMALAGVGAEALTLTKGGSSLARLAQDKVTAKVGAAAAIVPMHDGVR